MGALCFVFGLNLFTKKEIQFVPPAIATLAQSRWAAKQAKDFATADKLRAELIAAGWSMLDRKDGYDLKPLKNN